ncbi:UDP-glucose 4-epimerase GalE [Psychrobacter sp. I-STPA10]|uniref:UDP-glucose 4-epimerase GalE n=1 Tax=Psychrobacter sp. I-STPA10 TaxID=2585769 RepID=UPI001E2B7A53|nr:UDP-glucose 4-epimerase GalE [Psychrobacter sp. I-STPA10]
MGTASKKILVTGGVGYIGSHTCIELIASGYDIVVYDNLSNSNIEAIKRVEQITDKEIEFVQGDLLDETLLTQIFSQHQFFAVVHFAGLKAVGESVAQPLKYYKNNVAGTVNLLEVMQHHQVFNFVFSSSATVYGDPEQLPITETAPRSTTNPYGRTKLIIEYMLEDLCASDPRWQVVSLRYFNPVGAHDSGKIGEDPNGIPNNLMPYISQVAVGKLEKLRIFGNDYPTVDGTGVRDFIHVVDLAKGHISAIDYLVKNSTDKKESIGFFAVNLGTGSGTSVLQLVNAFTEATGQIVNYEFSPRRAGDVASCYAQVDLAEQNLNWQAHLDIYDMCKDTWHWQSQNPNGYEK